MPVGYVQSLVIGDPDPCLVHGKGSELFQKGRPLRRIRIGSRATVSIRFFQGGQQPTKQGKVVRGVQKGAESAVLG